MGGASQVGREASQSEPRAAAVDDTSFSPSAPSANAAPSGERTISRRGGAGEAVTRMEEGEAPGVAVAPTTRGGNEAATNSQDEPTAAARGTDDAFSPSGKANTTALPFLRSNSLAPQQPSFLQRQASMGGEIGDPAAQSQPISGDAQRHDSFGSHADPPSGRQDDDEAAATSHSLRASKSSSGIRRKLHPSPSGPEAEGSGGAPKSPSAHSQAVAGSAFDESPLHPPHHQVTIGDVVPSPCAEDRNSAETHMHDEAMKVATITLPRSHDEEAGEAVRDECKGVGTAGVDDEAAAGSPCNEGHQLPFCFGGEELAPEGSSPLHFSAIPTRQQQRQVPHVSAHFGSIVSNESPSPVMDAGGDGSHPPNTHNSPHGIAQHYGIISTNNNNNSTNHIGGSFSGVSVGLALAPVVPVPVGPSPSGGSGSNHNHLLMLLPLSAAGNCVSSGYGGSDGSPATALHLTARKGAATTPLGGLGLGSGGGGTCNNSNTTSSQPHQPPSNNTHTASPKGKRHGIDGESGSPSATSAQRTTTTTTTTTSSSSLRRSAITITTIAVGPTGSSSLPNAASSVTYSTAPAAAAVGAMASMPMPPPTPTRPFGGGGGATWARAQVSGSGGGGGGGSCGGGGGVHVGSSFFLPSPGLSGGDGAGDGSQEAGGGADAGLGARLRALASAARIGGIFEPSMSAEASAAGTPQSSARAPNPPTFAVNGTNMAKPTSPLVYHHAVATGGEGGGPSMMALVAESDAAAMSYGLAMGALLPPVTSSLALDVEISSQSASLAALQNYQLNAGTAITTNAQQNAATPATATGFALSHSVLQHVSSSSANATTPSPVGASTSGGWAGGHPQLLTPPNTAAAPPVTSVGPHPTQIHLSATAGVHTDTGGANSEPNAATNPQQQQQRVDFGAPFMPALPPPGQGLTTISLPVVTPFTPYFGQGTSETNHSQPSSPFAGLLPLAAAGASPLPLTAPATSGLSSPAPASLATVAVPAAVLYQLQLAMARHRHWGPRATAQSPVPTLPSASPTASVPAAVVGGEEVTPLCESNAPEKKVAGCPEPSVGVTATGATATTFAVSGAGPCTPTLSGGTAEEVVLMGGTAHSGTRVSVCLGDQQMAAEVERVGVPLAHMGSSRGLPALVCPDPFVLSAAALEDTSSSGRGGSSAVGVGPQSPSSIRPSAVHCLHTQTSFTAPTVSSETGQGIAAIGCGGEPARLSVISAVTGAGSSFTDSSAPRQQRGGSSVFEGGAPASGSGCITVSPTSTVYGGNTSATGTVGLGAAIGAGSGNFSLFAGVPSPVVTQSAIAVQQRFVEAVIAGNSNGPLSYASGVPVSLASLHTATENTFGGVGAVGSFVCGGGPAVADHPHCTSASATAQRSAIHQRLDQRLGASSVTIPRIVLSTSPPADESLSLPAAYASDVDVGAADDDEDESAAAPLRLHLHTEEAEGGRRSRSFSTSSCCGAEIPFGGDVDEGAEGSLIPLAVGSACGGDGDGRGVFAAEKPNTFHIGHLLQCVTAGSSCSGQGGSSGSHTVDPATAAGRQTYRLGGGPEELHCSATLGGKGEEPLLREVAGFPSPHPSCPLFGLPAVSAAVNTCQTDILGGKDALPHSLTEVETAGSGGQPLHSQQTAEVKHDASSMMYQWKAPEHLASTIAHPSTPPLHVPPGSSASPLTQQQTVYLARAKAGPQHLESDREGEESHSSIHNRERVVAIDGGQGAAEAMPMPMPTACDYARAVNISSVKSNFHPPEGDGNEAAVLGFEGREAAAPLPLRLASCEASRNSGLQSASATTPIAAVPLAAAGRPQHISALGSLASSIPASGTANTASTLNETFLTTNTVSVMSDSSVVNSGKQRQRGGGLIVSSSFGMPNLQQQQQRGGGRHRDEHPSGYRHPAAGSPDAHAGGSAVALMTAYAQPFRFFDASALSVSPPTTAAEVDRTFRIGTATVTTNTTANSPTAEGEGHQGTEGSPQGGGDAARAHSHTNYHFHQHHFSSSQVVSASTLSVATMLLCGHHQNADGDVASQHYRLKRGSPTTNAHSTMKDMERGPSGGCASVSLVTPSPSPAPTPATAVACTAAGAARRRSPRHADPYAERLAGATVGSLPFSTPLSQVHINLPPVQPADSDGHQQVAVESRTAMSPPLTPAATTESPAIIRKFTPVGTTVALALKIGESVEAEQQQVRHRLGELQTLLISSASASASTGASGGLASNEEGAGAMFAGCGPGNVLDALATPREIETEEEAALLAARVASSSSYADTTVRRVIPPLLHPPLCTPLGGPSAEGVGSKHPWEAVGTSPPSAYGALSSLSAAGTTGGAGGSALPDTSSLLLHSCVLPIRRAGGRVTSSASASAAGGAANSASANELPKAMLMRAPDGKGNPMISACISPSPAGAVAASSFSPGSGGSGPGLTSANMGPPTGSVSLSAATTAITSTTTTNATSSSRSANGNAAFSQASSPLGQLAASPSPAIVLVPASLLLQPQVIASNGNGNDINKYGGDGEADASISSPRNPTLMAPPLPTPTAADTYMYAVSSRKARRGSGEEGGTSADAAIQHSSALFVPTPAAAARQQRSPTIVVRVCDAVAAPTNTVERAGGEAAPPLLLSSSLDRHGALPSAMPSAGRRGPSLLTDLNKAGDDPALLVGAAALQHQQASVARIAVPHENEPASDAPQSELPVMELDGYACEPTEEAAPAVAALFKADKDSTLPLFPPDHDEAMARDLDESPLQLGSGGAAKESTSPEKKGRQGKEGKKKKHRVIAYDDDDVLSLEPLRGPHSHGIGLTFAPPPKIDLDYLLANPFPPQRPSGVGGGCVAATTEGGGEWADGGYAGATDTLLEDAADPFPFPAMPSVDYFFAEFGLSTKGAAVDKHPTAAAVTETSANVADVVTTTTLSLQDETAIPTTDSLALVPAPNCNNQLRIVKLAPPASTTASDRSGSIGDALLGVVGGRYGFGLASAGAEDHRPLGEHRSGPSVGMLTHPRLQYPVESSSSAIVETAHSGTAPAGGGIDDSAHGGSTKAPGGGSSSETPTYNTGTAGTGGGGSAAGSSHQHLLLSMGAQTPVQFTISGRVGGSASASVLGPVSMFPPQHPYAAYQQLVPSEPPSSALPNKFPSMHHCLPAALDALPPIGVWASSLPRDPHASEAPADERGEAAARHDLQPAPRGPSPTYSYGAGAEGTTVIGSDTFPSFSTAALNSYFSPLRSSFGVAGVADKVAATEAVEIGSTPTVDKACASSPQPRLQPQCAPIIGCALLSFGSESPQMEPAVFAPSIGRSFGVGNAVAPSSQQASRDSRPPLVSIAEVARRGSTESLVGLMGNVPSLFSKGVGTVKDGNALASPSPEGATPVGQRTHQSDERTAAANSPLATSRSPPPHRQRRREEEESPTTALSALPLGTSVSNLLSLEDLGQFSPSAGQRFSASQQQQQQQHQPRGWSGGWGRTSPTTTGPPTDGFSFAAEGSASGGWMGRGRGERGKPVVFVVPIPNTQSNSEGGGTGAATTTTTTSCGTPSATRTPPLRYAAAAMSSGGVPNALVAEGGPLAPSLAAEMLTEAAGANRTGGDGGAPNASASDSPLSGGGVYCFNRSSSFAKARQQSLSRGVGQASATAAAVGSGNPTLANSHQHFHSPHNFHQQQQFFSVLRTAFSSNSIADSSMTNARGGLSAMSPLPLAGAVATTAVVGNNGGSSTSAATGAMGGLLHMQFHPVAAWPSDLVGPSATTNVGSATHLSASTASHNHPHHHLGLQQYHLSAGGGGGNTSVNNRQHSSPQHFPQLLPFNAPSMPVGGDSSSTSTPALVAGVMVGPNSYRPHTQQQQQPFFGDVATGSATSAYAVGATAAAVDSVRAALGLGLGLPSEGRISSLSTTTIATSNTTATSHLLPSVQSPRMRGHNNNSNNYGKYNSSNNAFLNSTTIGTTASNSASSAPLAGSSVLLGNSGGRGGGLQLRSPPSTCTCSSSAAPSSGQCLHHSTCISPLLARGGNGSGKNNNNNTNNNNNNGIATPLTEGTTATTTGSSIAPLPIMVGTVPTATSTSAAADPPYPAISRHLPQAVVGWPSPSATASATAIPQSGLICLDGDAARPPAKNDTDHADYVAEEELRNVFVPFPAETPRNAGLQQRQKAAHSAVRVLLSPTHAVPQSPADKGDSSTFSVQGKMGQGEEDPSVSVVQPKPSADSAQAALDDAGGYGRRRAADAAAAKRGLISLGPSMTSRIPISTAVGGGSTALPKENSVGRRGGSTSEPVARGTAAEAVKKDREEEEEDSRFDLPTSSSNTKEGGRLLLSEPQIDGQLPSPPPPEPSQFQPLCNAGGSSFGMRVTPPPAIELPPSSVAANADSLFTPLFFSHENTNQKLHSTEATREGGGEENEEETREGGDGGAAGGADATSPALSAATPRWAPPSLASLRSQPPQRYRHHSAPNAVLNASNRGRARGRARIGAGGGEGPPSPPPRLHALGTPAHPYRHPSAAAAPAEVAVAMDDSEGGGSARSSAVGDSHHRHRQRLHHQLGAAQRGHSGGSNSRRGAGGETAGGEEDDDEAMIDFGDVLLFNTSGSSFAGSSNNRSSRRAPAGTGTATGTGTGTGTTGGGASTSSRRLAFATITPKLKAQNTPKWSVYVPSDDDLLAKPQFRATLERVEAFNKSSREEYVGLFSLSANNAAAAFASSASALGTPFAGPTGGFGHDSGGESGGGGGGALALLGAGAGGFVDISKALMEQAEREERRRAREERRRQRAIKEAKQKRKEEIHKKRDCGGSSDSASSTCDGGDEEGEEDDDHEEASILDAFLSGRGGSIFDRREKKKATVASPTAAGPDATCIPFLPNEPSAGAIATAFTPPKSTTRPDCSGNGGAATTDDEEEEARRSIAAAAALFGGGLVTFGAVTAGGDEPGGGFQGFRFGATNDNTAVNDSEVGRNHQISEIADASAANGVVGGRAADHPTNAGERKGLGFGDLTTANPFYAPPANAAADEEETTTSGGFGMGFGIGFSSPLSAYNSGVRLTPAPVGALSIHDAAVEEEEAARASHREDEGNSIHARAMDCVGAPEQSVAAATVANGGGSLVNLFPLHPSHPLPPPSGIAQQQQRLREEAAVSDEALMGCLPPPLAPACPTAPINQVRAAAEAAEELALLGSEGTLGSVQHSAGGGESFNFLPQNADGRQRKRGGKDGSSFATDNTPSAELHRTANVNGTCMPCLPRDENSNSAEEPTQPNLTSFLRGQRPLGDGDSAGVALSPSAPDPPRFDGGEAVVGRVGDEKEEEELTLLGSEGTLGSTNHWAGGDKSFDDLPSADGPNWLDAAAEHGGDRARISHPNQRPQSDTRTSDHRGVFEDVALAL